MKLIDLRLLRQAKSSRLNLGITIILGFAGGIFTVIQAWLLSKVINGVFLGNMDLMDSRHMLGLLLLIFVGRAAALWAGTISAKQVALQVKTTLREKLYAHIQKLGPLFTRGERTGELVNAATEGIEALDSYFSEYLPQIILAALVPLTYLFFVFPIDHLSGFVLLLTAPLIPIFMVLIGDQADSMTKRQWRTLSRMSAHFLDVLQGLTTLKLFGRSRAQINVIRQVSEQFRFRTMGVLRVAFLSALVLEMVATLSTAIVAVEIGLRLLYGRLAFEQALFVLLLAPEFYLPLRMLGTRFHAGVTGLTAAGRIFEILDDQATNNKVTLENELSPSYQKTNIPITFESVSYTYPDGHIALRNVTLTINPGEKVALVGPSGAGKSTAAELLLGWMKPDTGRLTGTVSDLGVAWLPQSPYLFHDSITENIRIARPYASLDEVISAARAAHAHEFIERTGYDTIIGERGALLSAGQAQRIALARAFLMDAPFVVLDEPAANLDPVLEAQITKSLDHLLDNRTALIIAHRINTIRNADKIIVLDEGQVVQQGTYDELIAQGGLFRSLVNTAGEFSAEDQMPEINEGQTVPERGDHISEENHILPQNGPDSIPYSPGSAFLRLLSFLRLNLGWIALSITLGSLTIASGIGLMATSAYIISAAALQPSIAVLQVPIVGVRFFGVSRGLFRYLERLVSHQTTFRVLAQLRIWFYTQLEPLAPARLQQYRSGELLTRIISHINSLENFYIRVVAPPLIASLVALLAGLLLMVYAPQLSLALWIFLALAGILLPWWNFRLARGLGNRVLSARTTLNDALIDGLQGLPDLLAFGRGADQLQRIRELGKQLAHIQLVYTRLSGLGAALMNLLTNLGMWIILVLSIPLVSTGQIEGVYLATIAMIAMASFESVSPLPFAAQHLEENLRAASHLFQIVDTKPEVATPHDPNPVPDDITMVVRDLAFSYEPLPEYRQRPAGSPHPFFSLHLSDISLSFGKSIAIIGPSGSGKTTLLNLLLRFWDFKKGYITLGGQDIRSIDPDELRSQFAVVSQHTYLFNASLWENLRVGKPGASETEIQRMTRAAQIHDFIEALPQGYQTIVGEQGLRLSGGERQRIAIARALLKDAPILILDEPTLNLDQRTELAVLESIHNLMQDRSILLVTHRLVGMAWMDEILVLGDGKIVERGTHHELLAQGGLYQRMWRLQNHWLGSA